MPNDSDGEGPESEDEMERPQFSGKSLPSSNPKARPKEILGIRVSGRSPPLSLFK